MTNTYDQYVQVTVQETPNLVTIDEDDPTLVYVATTGARGPGVITGVGEPDLEDGLPGDIYINSTTGDFWGPKTGSGWGATPFYAPGNTVRHVHTQASASSTWTINHTLGGYPSVMVVDTASTVVIGEVSYISTTQVRVSFTAPFSGFAYLT